MSEVGDYISKNGGKFQSLEIALKNLTYEVQPIPAIQKRSENLIFSDTLKLKVKSCVLCTKVESIKFEKIIHNPDRKTLDKLKNNKVFKVVGDQGQEIHSDETIKGFKFCDSIIPLNSFDASALEPQKKTKEELGMQFITFLPETMVNSHYFLNQSTRVMFSDEKCAKSAQFLASFADFLGENELCALFASQLYVHSKSKLSIVSAYENRFLMINTYPYSGDYRYYDYERKVESVELDEEMLAVMDNYVNNNLKSEAEIMNQNDPYFETCLKSHRLILDHNKEKSLNEIIDKNEDLVHEMHSESIDLNKNLSQIDNFESVFGEVGSNHLFNEKYLAKRTKYSTKN